MSLSFFSSDFLGPALRKGLSKNIATRTWEQKLRNIFFNRCCLLTSIILKVNLNHSFFEIITRGLKPSQFITSTGVCDKPVAKTGSIPLVWVECADSAREGGSRPPDGDTRSGESPLGDRLPPSILGISI